MIETLTSLGFLGLVALIGGIIYIVLASRANYYAWWFGILSCGIIAYEDFSRYQLFADGALQVFYVVMGFLALLEWKETDEQGDIVIRTLTLKYHIWWSTGVIGISILVGWLLNRFTQAELPYLDTVTSLFAVLATWFLVKRILENWWYWLVIDVLYIYIYGRQEAWFYVVLTVIYTIVAAYALVNWTRMYRAQQKE